MIVHSWIPIWHFNICHNSK
uniref:Putative indole-3-acetic acid-amido synthetase GH3.5 n=1 Tax=Rhizophora mucronata TaxID=61149 RepID=A0A2P2KCQ2_RHIMU